MAIFEYRASPSDRWLVVDPWIIYDHDFKNPDFQLKMHNEERSCLIRSWDHFQAIRERECMADYSKAGPEKGEVVNDAINPAHYKQLLVIKDSYGNLVDTVQWLEHLQYKPFWRNNMRAFVQAVMDMCCDKYLARMGMKDEELQEMEKSLWYHNFATAIMKNGYRPVRVSDVEAILNGTLGCATTSNEKYEVAKDAEVFERYFVHEPGGALMVFDNGLNYTYSRADAVAWASRYGGAVLTETCA